MTAISPSLGVRTGYIGFCVDCQQGAAPGSGWRLVVRGGASRLQCAPCATLDKLVTGEREARWTEQAFRWASGL